MRSQHIVQRGWRIWNPHEDKVDVITPVTIILFRGGGFFKFDDDDDDDDNDDDDGDDDDDGR